MRQPATMIDERNAEQMRELIRRLRRDISQFEAMLSRLRTTPTTDAADDIFAEMAGVMANAPDADDSRQAIYTRMPGE